MHRNMSNLVVGLLLQIVLLASLKTQAQAEPVQLDKGSWCFQNESGSTHNMSNVDSCIADDKKYIFDGATARYSSCQGNENCICKEYREGTYCFCSNENCNPTLKPKHSTSEKGENPLGFCMKKDDFQWNIVEICVPDDKKIIFGDNFVATFQQNYNNRKLLQKDKTVEHLRSCNGHSYDVDRCACKDYREGAYCFCTSAPCNLGSSPSGYTLLHLCSFLFLARFIFSM